MKLCMLQDWAPEPAILAREEGRPLEESRAGWPWGSEACWGMCHREVRGGSVQRKMGQEAKLCHGAGREDTCLRGDGCLDQF